MDGFVELERRRRSTNCRKANQLSDKKISFLQTDLAFEKKMERDRPQDELISK